MTVFVTDKFVSQKRLKKLWKPMQLTNGNEERYSFGFEYAFDDRYYHFSHNSGNHVKLRYYFNPNNRKLYTRLCDYW